MNRYAIISEKNPREIALLVGRGCFWKKCTFCDYHLDASKDPEQSFALNKQVLDQVTGQFSHLEIINSGSIFELDSQSLDYILATCVAKNIRTLHFEAHYSYHRLIAPCKERFAQHGIQLKFKIGVESFDEHLRETILYKGMGQVTAQQIAAHFDECCLLIGFAGQTEQTIRADIQTGLAHFERICLNLFEACSAPLKPDQQVIELFMRDIYPEIANNKRIDILINNTDFGVGEVTTN